MKSAPSGDAVLKHKLSSSQVSLAEMMLFPHGHDFSWDRNLGVIAAPSQGDLPQFDVMPADVATELAEFAEQMDGARQRRRDGRDYSFLMVTNFTCVGVDDCRAR